MVELAVLHEFIKPARVSYISPIVLFLDSIVAHIFQEYLLKLMIVKVASWWLNRILPETSILVLFNHILDLIISQLGVSFGRVQ